ncbi:MAG: PepSY domain-containing protein, partial [Motiliproteus sp.]
AVGTTKMARLFRVMAVGVTRMARLFRAITAVVMAGALHLGAVASPLDQDDVLPLIEQGQVLPLAELLKRHQSRLAGRLIDLELEYEQGRLVYELEVIDPQGVVREYLIDAKSGEWLGEE